MIVELKAHIDKDGKIVVETPADLPPGDVEIVITYLTDEEKEDEALWDEQFAAPLTSVFERLIDEGLQEFRLSEKDMH